MSERGGILPLLIWLVVGLMIGGILGLLLGWVAWPIEITEADPAALEATYQRDYVLMVATAYTADGDLRTAQKRLAALRLEDQNGYLLALAVDAILEEWNEADIRRLVTLASALDLYSPVMDPYLPGSGQEGGG